MNAMRALPRHRRRHVSLLLFGAALLAIGWLLWHSRGDIASLLSQADQPRLLRSILWLIPIYLLNALGWRLTLCAFGVRIGMRAAFWIWMSSSLGRYLPGAIWPYASRIGLAMAAGVPVAVATASVYVETLLVAATSAMVALPALGRVEAGGHSLWLAAVGILVLVLAAPLTLRLARYLPARVGTAFAAMASPSKGAMAALSAYYVGFWLVVGLAFWDFACALHPGLPIATSTSAMALSFFAGFIVFLAPGGLGVREAALYAILLPHAAPPAALAIAVGSRLWFMAGELIALLLAAVLRPRTAPGAAP